MYTQSNTYQKFCFSHHSFIFFVFFLQIHIMRCVSILCGCVAIWLHFKDHLPDTRHRVECIHIVILAVKLVRRVAVESWRLSRSRSKCSMLRLFKWGFEDFERTTKTPRRRHDTRIDTMDTMDTMNSQARASWSLLAPRCWPLGSLVPGWVRNSGCLSNIWMKQAGLGLYNYNIYNDYWHSTYLNLVWYWYALHWALPVASLRFALLWPSAGHWSSTMSSRLSKARFRLTIVSRTLQRFHKRRPSNTETLSNLEANLCSCMFL